MEGRKDETEDGTRMGGILFQSSLSHIMNAEKSSKNIFMYIYDRRLNKNN